MLIENKLNTNFTFDVQEISSNPIKRALSLSDNSKVKILLNDEAILKIWNS